jgi:hypothetical protein
MKLFVSELSTPSEWSVTESTTGLLYQLWIMMDVDEYGVIGRMLGRGNQSTCRELAPVPCFMHHKSLMT